MYTTTEKKEREQKKVQKKKMRSKEQGKEFFLFSKSLMFRQPSFHEKRHYLGSKWKYV